MQRTASSVSLLQFGEFAFKTVAQAYDLAALISRACPKQEQQLNGLAELMVNAVEHGNLGISYQEKGQLLKLLRSFIR